MNAQTARGQGGGKRAPSATTGTGASGTSNSSSSASDRLWLRSSSTTCGSICCPLLPATGNSCELRWTSSFLPHRNLNVLRAHGSGRGKPDANRSGMRAAKEIAQVGFMRGARHEGKLAPQQARKRGQCYAGGVGGGVGGGGPRNCGAIGTRANARGGGKGGPTCAPNPQRHGGDRNPRICGPPAKSGVRQ